MSEKRLHRRFGKQYTMQLAVRDKSQKIYDMPLLRDISRGGVNFISSDYHSLGTKIIFNIKFPFLSPVGTIIEGEVVGVQEAPGRKGFQIKCKFINVSPPAEAALQQMERFNLENK